MTYSTSSELRANVNTTGHNSSLEPSFVKSNGEIEEDLKASHEDLLNEELDNLKVTKQEATFTRMILSQPFIVLYIMNFLSIISGFFAVNNFKKYGQLNGLTNEDYLAWLGSIAAICNASRFIWSFMTDYFPYKLIYGILVSMQIALNFTIMQVAESELFYAIWISLLLLCEGGHFTLAPNVLKKIYGSDQGTALYGILFSFSGCMSILIVIL